MMRLEFPLGLALAFALACAGAPKKDADEEEVDGDGDGLLDSEEAEIGSDPANVDSDEDGYEDGAEVDGHTDPLDADDKPYQAGWQIDACRNDTESTGSDVGDVVENFEFGDQFGERLHLHDFCDQVVLVVGAGFT
ncbi:MAG: hypothetical protein Q8P41_28990 [Pseudomonadota bacterium]|nr:hypothetical protein [Pseudomonadota bacterium]